MKKLLAMAFCAVLSIGAASASTLSNAIKSDVNTVKSAVKTDINNQAAQRTSTAAAKKEAKIKQLDNRLAALNKELNDIKNDKTITETQRAIELKRIQTQIDICKKQKSALK